MPHLFENETAKMQKQSRGNEREKEEMYKRIGKLTTHMEWLKKNLIINTGIHELQQVVEPYHPSIPVSLQASLLGINRTSPYYKPHPLDRNDLAIKELFEKTSGRHFRIMEGYADELWLKFNTSLSDNCFYGCTELSNYADIPSSWK